MASSLLDDEFQEAYTAFVDNGGLDQTLVPNEDWEREQRQHVYCTHSIPKGRCEFCRKQPLPAVFNGYRGEQ